jgi:DNA-binding transcriptional LysR family regulator
MNAPLDSRQLHAFSILARTGSFTQTARELFLTQSAVSHSMKSLETDVGCRLLDRLGKKVSLTQAGEQLLVHAERVLEEMSLARAGLERLGKWGTGRLRLVAPAALCAYLLPSVLREFKDSFPQSLISVEVADSAMAVGMIEANRADLALTLEHKSEDRLQFAPLFSDELVFIAAPNHPWARAHSVPPAEIPRQSMVVYGKHSLTWRIVDSHFRSEGVTLNSVIEMGSFEALKELVKINLGVGILAPWVAESELRDGSLVALPLGLRSVRRDWGAIHWRSRRLTLAEETFLGLCRTASARLLRAEDIIGVGRP